MLKACDLFLFYRKLPFSCRPQLGYDRFDQDDQDDTGSFTPMLEEMRDIIQRGSRLHEFTMERRS